MCRAGRVPMVGKDVIKTDKAPLPVARYSQAIKCGNLVFVQGVIAIDPSTGKVLPGNIKDHTIQVFKNISAVLGEIGLDLSHILRTTVFLMDLSDYDEFNHTYNMLFEDKIPPARTTVQAKIPLGSKLEVETTAYVPDSDDSA